MQHGEEHCTVVFLRHGQSTWNHASLFTGWADVELTTLGKNEAAGAATALWKEGIVFDVAYTSRLKRAHQTLDIVLTITGQEDVPTHATWRLNERMYGGLTGLNKKETAAKYGAEQVKTWRRSYDTRPPDVDKTSQYYPGNDLAYCNIAEEDIPLAECLKDTVERTLPYWDHSIVPALERGKTVLIAAHGNSIRGMLKSLDQIPDDAIVDIEIPTGVPLVYRLDASLQPIRSERASGLLNGAFLADQAELEAAQKAVADQSAIRYGEKETKDEVQFMCMGSGCLMLSTSDLEEAFSGVDVDGDGYITADELKDVAVSLSEDDDVLSDSEANEMFALVDRDKDGRIDFEEFVQAMTAERALA